MTDTNPISWDTLRRDLEGQAAYYIAMHTTPEKAREAAWCIVNASLPAGYEPTMRSGPPAASVRSELVAHEGMRLEVKLDVTDPAVLTEYGDRLGHGAIHLYPRRPVSADVAHASINEGRRVLRRRVLVVEDWTEVPAENGDSE